VRQDMHEGGDEIRAGEGHQEREHGEEPRGGKVGLVVTRECVRRRDKGEENDDEDDEHS